MTDSHLSSPPSSEDVMLALRHCWQPVARLEDLKDGPGHYPDTADPWEDSGRVGIAGHRTTYQAPFFNLDDMRVGDEITLRTKYGSFAYEVDRIFVVPSSGSGRVLVQTPKPTLVLTTCNPKYSSAERLIVTARRVSDG